jgi:hypothetical protein
MNLDQRIYIIKELEIQRQEKIRAVANLTRESVVLSATIKHLTTPEVVSHPLYHLRHERTALGDLPSQIPSELVTIVGHQLTVISNPHDESPVAIALAQDLTRHPLGYPDTERHGSVDSQSEEEEDTITGTSSVN